MAVDERARHELYARLVELLGEREATTLMSCLLPPGPVELAEKRDLDQLADRLRAEFQEAVTAQTRLLVFAIVGSNATLAGLAFAAARLA